MSDEFKTFYITFGQKSPARNGYVTIIARNRDRAHQKAMDTYGPDWSMLYKDKDFEPEYFPAGQLGVIGQCST